jgi:hypothetical protein
MGRSYSSLCSCIIHLLQANYINALAVSVLPFFEPAKPITLGELFVTLGELFFTLGESFSLFFRLSSM